MGDPGTALFGSVWAVVPLGPGQSSSEQRRGVVRISPDSRLEWTRVDLVVMGVVGDCFLLPGAESEDSRDVILRDDSLETQS